MRGFSKHIRSIITLSFVGLIIYGFVEGSIGPEYIMGLATGIFGSYFEDNKIINETNNQNSN
jgi:hypothetical protein